MKRRMRMKMQTSAMSVLNYFSTEDWKFQNALVSNEQSETLINSQSMC